MSVLKSSCVWCISAHGTDTGVHLQERSRCLITRRGSQAPKEACGCACTQGKCGGPPSTLQCHVCLTEICALASTLSVTLPINGILQHLASCIGGGQVLWQGQSREQP